MRFLRLLSIDRPLPAFMVPARKMQMKLPPGEPADTTRLSSVAVARAMIPSTARLEGAGHRTVVHTEGFIEKMHPHALGPWRAAHRLIDETARTLTGRPLHALSPRQAEETLDRLLKFPVVGRLIAAMGMIYKVTHFDLPDTRGSLRTLREPRRAEHDRWESQIIRGEDWDDDEQVECDVVVIGTGAGGAVVGRHLADQGHAVVFVEEGELVRRHQFSGSFKATMEQFYRHSITMGNAPILIPQGKLVGGSTAVNTGTSFRPPRWVTDRWCEETGSDEFSSDSLSQHYDRVESMLQVEPADLRFSGPSYDVFREASEALGWHYDTIRRNAPGCRGEGMCDNGCPTDARRSTLISYLPGALERGNIVLSGLRANKILIEGGRAVGLEGTVLKPDGTVAQDSRGRDRHIRIRAKRVILAGGAMCSPQMLLRQNLGNKSGQVGRNLTLHPSGPSVALYDRLIEGHKYIPQTAYSHEFLKEGLMLLNAHADPHMMPATTGLLGQRLMRVFEQSSHVACNGFLLAEEARGRIRLDPQGRTLMTYNLTKHDVKRIHRAQVLLAEMHFAAGAKEVFPGINPAITLFDRKSLDSFAKRRLGAGDFLLTSYHPLGTCRMSPDPRKGVVDLNHQVHDVPGLHVVDGSSVSGPLGVNPQLTIMAYATRAAEKIGARID